MTSSKFAIRTFKEAIKDLNEGNVKGYFAVLGKLDRTVETGDSNRVYVTTFEGQIVTVINRRIPNTPGLLVLVGVDDHSANRVEIIYAINAFGDTNDGLDTITNIVPPHSHSYPEQNTTWMYDSQFIPLLALPVAGSMTVQVYPGVIRNYGSSGWTFIDNQTVDLSGDVPGSGACWVTLQANDDGSVDYVVGSTAADRESLTDTDIPEPTTGRALVAIILEEGHTELQRNNVANDFFDLRFDILGWYEHNDLPGIDGGGDYLGTLEAYHLSLYEWEGLIKGLNADDLHIHNASAIAYDPYGCIEATNVQDAIEELETKVDNLPTGGGGSWDGDITDIDETSSADIGEAIADGDQGIIYNASTGAWVRFAWSRVKTYIQALTDTLYIAISGNVSQANMEELADGSTTNLHNHGIAAEVDSNDIFRCDSPGGISAFVGTIATLPGGATLTYNITSGQEGAMVPTSTSQLAKMRLYNTTRGTYALISNCITGTNTIILTDTVPAGWVVTDVITIASQTVVGAISFVDLEIYSGPTGKNALFLNTTIVSATVGDSIRLHPHSAYSTSKFISGLAQVANTAHNSFCLLQIISDVFAFAWTGTPTAVVIREAGYIT